MRRPLISIAVCLAALWLPAVAAAAQTPLQEYQSTGTINACNHPGGLGGGVPNDVAQYAPDYLAALNAARARGCQPGGGAGSGSGSGGANGTNATAPTPTGKGGRPLGPDGQPLPVGSTYVPRPPAPPAADGAQRTARHLALPTRGDSATPAPIIALAVIMLLLLAGAAIAAAWRYMGWGVDWLDPVRHAFGEAFLRAGSAASGAADAARSAVRLRR